MIKFNKLVLIFLFFLSTIVNSYAACLPSDFKQSNIPINTTTNESLKGKVHVFYDASLSMSGFTKSQPDEVNLYGTILNNLQQVSQSLGTETIYNTFGSRFETIDENRASLVTTQKFYTCTQSAQNCAVKDRISDLSKVLGFAKKKTDSTIIIVTDLFVSTSETLAKNAERLKKPLKEIFNKNQSIGIFGVSSAFNGKISGIPSETGIGYVSYSEATKRPFYIIVIGSGENINFVKAKIEKNQKLQDSIAEDPDTYKFTMITSNVVSKNLNVDKKILDKNLTNINAQSEGYKFQYKDNLPIYEFVTSKKNFELKFDNSDFIVPGSNGVSEYKIEQQLWSLRGSCKKNDKWGKSKRNNFVSHNPDVTDDTLTLNFFENKGLTWGLRWFTFINVYTARNGSSSQDEFKNWDLTDSSAAGHLKSQPKFFKTLNLMTIIEMFNDIANEEFKPTLVASIALNFELEK